MATKLSCKRTAGIPVKKDRLGNLILRLGDPTGRKMLLDAHMDSIGFAINDIRPDGTLGFRAIGFAMPAALVNSEVCFLRGGSGTIRLEKGTSPERATMDQLYIQLQTAGHGIGDLCVYAPAFQAEQTRVTAPYLDNRAGCLAMLLALPRMRLSPNDLYVVFSVQEEVGMRGAQLAARQIEPDYAFAVDMGVAGDIPGAKINRNIRLGGGVINKVLDDSIVCHEDAVTLLTQAAASAEVAMGYSVGGAGFTNAGLLHLAGSGVKTGILGIPARNLHTVKETVDITDIVGCAKVLCALANSRI